MEIYETREDAIRCYRRLCGNYLNGVLAKKELEAAREKLIAISFATRHDLDRVEEDENVWASYHPKGGEESEYNGTSPDA